MHGADWPEIDEPTLEYIVNQASCCVSWRLKQMRLAWLGCSFSSQTPTRLALIFQLDLNALSLGGTDTDIPVVWQLRY